MKNEQLADVLRPRNFDEMVGQEHLFGEKGVLRRMLAGGRVTNMIFYGPPGIGKTTAAELIAHLSGMTFRRLNATTASLSDVKAVLAETENVFGMSGILLYLDEIQYFNRKQQQSLLEYMEDGRITLIASTTENPHFYIYPAILSRASLFEFKPVRPAECARALRRALQYLNEQHNTQKTADDALLQAVAKATGGDVRRAIVLLENVYFAADETLTDELVGQYAPAVGHFDDDTHYDLLSCLQKSIRGSDPDATAFYVARLCDAGELISLCRRLQVIASEDIGLAYPQAAMITRACCESAKELGFPEGRIPLIHAALLLATSPKSNSAYNALAAAAEDFGAGKGRTVPLHLQSPLFKGYKYPHDYPNHYVEQQYLPDDLVGKKYYEPAPNKQEMASAEYWARVKGEKK
ncbi:MAG: replication-associated recombination protein A [Clostridia bacterium]|nr:replication-associated recombination protein A [Clostridia bacterium]